MSHLPVPRPGAGPPSADLVAAGFLARYSGGTLEVYSSHLRIFFAWCAEHDLGPLEVTRTHLELFRRYLQADRGNGPGTINTRLHALRSFFGFAVLDGYLATSPALHVNIPPLPRDDARLTGVDREELNALIATARATGPVQWALVVLMGLLGLRVSEACSIQIPDAQGTNRGHRTVAVWGKGAKPATMPVPDVVAQAIDAAAGDRTSGPLLLRRDGRGLDRRTAYRWVKILVRKAGVNPRIHPHSLRHAFVTLSLDAGVPLRDVQASARHTDPRMTQHYDRARGALDRHAVHRLVDYLADDDADPAPES